MKSKKLQVEHFGYSMKAISGFAKLLSAQNENVILDGDISNGIAFLSRLAAESISELPEDERKVFEDTGRLKMLACIDDLCCTVLREEYREMTPAGLQGISKILDDIAEMMAEVTWYSLDSHALGSI